jgi:hypothetical protein
VCRLVIFGVGVFRFVRFGLGVFRLVRFGLSVFFLILVIKLGVKVIVQVRHYVLLLILGECFLGKRISAYLLQQVLVVFFEPPRTILVLPHLRLHDLSEGFVNEPLLLLLVIHPGKNNMGARRHQVCFNTRSRRPFLNTNFMFWVLNTR